MNTQNNVGHIIAPVRPGENPIISIAPLNARVDDRFLQHVPEEVIDENNSEEKNLYPSNPIAFQGRVPLPYKIHGYFHVGAQGSVDSNLKLPNANINMNIDINKDESEENESDEVVLAKNEASPLEENSYYVSNKAFEKIVESFKGENGEFLSMTAYGAVPLPEELLKNIPEHFVSQPKLQEREIFVLKQEHKTNKIEQEFTQYEHKFEPVPTVIEINKITVEDDLKIIDVPRFKYVPVVEEKIQNVPKGIKYVEVPVEVKCQMPPRLVPVAKPHIIERLIEKTKPVVQEKIIEVPEIVKKKVPRVVVKEIPYVVAKYVEKVIEVPYNLDVELPDPKGGRMTRIPKPPIMPRNPLKTQPVPKTASGRVEKTTLIIDDNSEEPQTVYLAPDIEHVELPYEAQIDVEIINEDSVPPGAPIAQKDVRYMAPGSKAMAYQSNNPNFVDNPLKLQEQLYAGPMDPIIEHAAPGMRAVNFRTRNKEPDILTQQGVLKYSTFECCLKEDASKLLPNLPKHKLVPMHPEGTPDIKVLTFMHSQMHNRRASNL